MRKWFLTLSSALLASCGTRGEAPANGANVSADPVGKVAAVDGEPWRCEDGRTVLVAYSDDGGVTLGIGGKAFKLDGMPAASGEKYQIVQGPTPGKRLNWWSKGEEAMLIERPILSPEEAEDETVVKCVKGKG